MISYIVLIELELEAEIFAIIQGILGTLEIDMPEFEIIGGEYSFYFWVFLD